MMEDTVDTSTEFDIIQSPFLFLIFSDIFIFEKMLIDLTQHTTRCSNRSDKSQEHLISSHAAVETEAEFVQV